MFSNGKRIKDGRNKVEREEIWHEPGHYIKKP